PGRGAAYVATGAIALAFFFSLTGFVWYTEEHHSLIHEHGLLPGLRDGHGHANHGAGAHAGEAKMEKEGDDAEEGHDPAEEKAYEDAVSNHRQLLLRWSGSWQWLRIKPAGISDADKGTVLRVGYYIDSLAALMFVMVSFVSGLIHL